MTYHDISQKILPISMNCRASNHLLNLRQITHLYVHRLFVEAGCAIIAE